MSKKPISYTTDGLRMALIDEINGLRNGTTSIEKAKTICNLAKQVFNISKVEIEFQYAKKNGLAILSPDVKLVTTVSKATR